MIPIVAERGVVGDCFPFLVVLVSTFMMIPNMLPEDGQENEATLDLSITPMSKANLSIDTNLKCRNTTSILSQQHFSSHIFSLDFFFFLAKMQRALPLHYTFRAVVPDHHIAARTYFLSVLGLLVVEAAIRLPPWIQSLRKTQSENLPSFSSASFLSSISSPLLNVRI